MFSLFHWKERALLRMKTMGKVVSRNRGWAHFLFWEMWLPSFFVSEFKFFMLGWGSSLLFWRTRCQGRPEKFSQFSWSWILLHSWRVSYEKLTLWSYVIPNIFRRLRWDPINELVNEVLVRITIYWGDFLSCWQRNTIQKNEWLIMIKLHQSKNIFRELQIIKSFSVS